MAGESMVGIMKEYLPHERYPNDDPLHRWYPSSYRWCCNFVQAGCQKPLDWVTFAFGFILAGALGLNLIVSAVVAVFFAVLNYLQQAKEMFVELLQHQAM